MKKIFIPVLVFLLSIFLGVFLFKYQSPKLYQLSKEATLKFFMPIKSGTITINSCVEEEAEDIGEVFLGKALQNALKLKYEDVSIDYRLKMYPKYKNNEIHIYLRGYFKFLPPFPDAMHTNIAYIIYPLFYTHYDAKMIKNRDKIVIHLQQYYHILIHSS